MKVNGSTEKQQPMKVYERCESNNENKRKDVRVRAYESKRNYVEVTMKIKEICGSNNLENSKYVKVIT